MTDVERDLSFSIQAPLSTTSLINHIENFSKVSLPLDVFASSWNSFVSVSTVTVNFFTEFARAVTLPETTFTPLNTPIIGIARMLKGASAAEADVLSFAATIRYVLILFLVYGISAVFALISNPKLKHLISAASGIFLAQWMFGIEWFNSLFSSLVTYVLLWIAQNFAPLGRYRHILIMVWMMGYMTAAHLWRLHVDYLGWTMDYTGPQMILTIKLTSLAFNLYDGYSSKRYDTIINKNKELLADKTTTDDKRKKASFENRTLENWKKLSTEKLPDLLSFLGYVYLPSSFFAGPAFEYSTYEATVNGTIFQQKSKDNKIVTLDYDWKNRLIATVQKLFFGLILLGLTVFAMNNGIAASTMYSVPVVTGMTFLERIRWNWIVLFFARCKYYFAWLVAEGSTNLAGFGYEPATDKKAASWEGVKNIDILGFELATDITSATKAWNVGTSKWLSQYCGSRVPRSISMNAVYFLSAFWHGFYPGYYLTFLSVPLFQDLEKTIKGKITPYYFPNGKDNSVQYMVYNVLSIVFTSLALNYLVCSFQALSWDYSMVIWSSLYFCGHIIAYVLNTGINILYKTPKSKSN